MKILILGGTTFVGREITNALSTRGHQVSVFSHTKNRLPEDLRFYERLKGERENLTDLTKAAKHAPWDIVIDNLAFNAAAVDLALNVFTNVKRYILTSTISVYRYSRFGTRQPYHEDFVDHDLRPAEEDLTDVHWQYARGKLEAERQLIRQKKTPWTIFRPTMVYGPYDNKHRGDWYLARLLGGGPILMPDGGTKLLRLAYAPSLAALYTLAVENDKCAGQIYNVAQAEAVTLVDFVRDSAEALGVAEQIVSVPASQLLGSELGGPLAMPLDWDIDATKAESHLGFKHAPWDKFIGDTARWFRNHAPSDQRELLTTRAKELELAANLPKLAL